MTKFNYTDSMEDIDSTAVSDAFYNVNDKTLAIVIADSDDAYRYTGVPSYVWNSFKASGSKGSYYATTIKRNYGPSAYLGNFYNIEFIDESSFVAPNMGPVGTPKGLTDPATTTSAQVFPLSSPAVQAKPSATTSVVFAVGGSEKTATFDNIGNAEDAVAEINRIAAMMGLDDLKVKSVTVHFE